MAEAAGAPLDRALALMRADRPDEAAAACRRLLDTEPGNADALNLLGILAGQRGRLDEAIDCFQRARELKPREAFILSNLAEALRLRGRPGEALPLILEAVTISPGYIAGHYRHALTLIDLGRLNDAIAACRAGLARQPQEANLSGLAADLLIQQQRLPEAAPFLYAALKSAPEIDLHWKRLNQFLRIGVLQPIDGRPWLMKALAHPVIRPAEISGSIARTLHKEPLIAGLIAVAERGDRLETGTLVEHCMRLSRDLLLLTLMQSVTIPYTPFERMFTRLRRELLFAQTGESPVALPAAALPFCAALAIQAFLTDYAWFITDEEDAQLSRIDATTPAGLALAGCYSPLHRLTGVDFDDARSWPPAFRELLRIQVAEPREEQALRAQIEALTPIADEVSQRVRAQYEENPYPRWVRAARSPVAESLPLLLLRLGGEVPDDPAFATPKVLIAGCGTGQQSIVAASFYRDARILAIDLSLASLAYALRKTRELGIGNIEYRQADLLDLGRLEQRFHVIECGGVLHHLGDPLAGWRVLTDLLLPGGLMSIGLYSELARRAVVEARAQIAAQGHTASADDIRRCRHELLALPDDHPLAALRAMRDLYNLSETRDLLFHVQEHRFTLPRIAEMLDGLGLRFLGFHNLMDAGAYRRRYPDDPRMQSLANWHLYEQDHPDTFSGMYKFLVQKPL